MWLLEDPHKCHYYGYDRHGLRTHLTSKDRNEEEALWEFLSRSFQYLEINPTLEKRIFPLEKPSFPLTPIEVFQKVSPVQRRKLFFKCLNRGDIFYLKVIEEKTDCFKLLAVDKYKGCMKIDDLGVMMDLPKLPQELKHLFPHPFSVIKAALSSCNIKERSLCVTLDKSIVKPEYQDVSLGPLYENYNLHYHGNSFLGISFTDNLFMTGEIRVRNRLPELSILGIKENTEYSHFKKSNKRIFSLSLSRSSLKRRLLQTTATTYYETAVASMDEGRVKKALSHLKQALYIWNEYPEALLLAGKCYNIIGNTPNAFMCTMKDFESYPSPTAARKQMCVMLVDAAKAHLSYNDKSLARESLEMARIIDPHNENAIRLQKEAKLHNSSSGINPDEKYQFPCPFKEEVDVVATDTKHKRKHHKRKSSKKKHETTRHQKHHKSSKHPLSPKKSVTPDTPFKAHAKSKFKAPPPTKQDPFESEETMKYVLELLEKAQMESRMKRGYNESLFWKSAVPNNPLPQEIPFSSPFTGCIQSNPNILEFIPPQPIPTSACSTPQETLKSLYELAEKAKREIQIQNQMKAAKLMQSSSQMMASEDTSILNTIISTTSKLLSITQDLVKNSPHSSILSENLPLLLQSHLLSNQQVSQRYPLNQIPQQIECAHPTQTFLTNPLCLDPNRSYPNQFNEAPIFPVPVSEYAASIPPQNEILTQSNNEGTLPVEANSQSQSVQPSNIPFLEYPTTCSTSEHSKHSFQKWSVNPSCTSKNVSSDSLVKQPNSGIKIKIEQPDSGSQIKLEDQNKSVPAYKDCLQLSQLKTKYFKPLSPGLNKSTSASDTQQRADDVHKNETSLPVSIKKETRKRAKTKSPEKSRRTPKRYRLTPPKKKDRSSRRHRSRSPRKREGSHTRRSDRSPRRHRSRSPRRRRSRSYSPRKYRDRSFERSCSRSGARSRSNSFKRSRSNSLKRLKSSCSKRSRSRSPGRYRRKVHLRSRSPIPLKSSFHLSSRKGPKSSIPYDPSENLCDVVVSSPSFSDSSPVNYFETGSPSTSTELMKEVSYENPYRSLSPDVPDQKISLVGLHSQSPPWQRRVSITTKLNRNKGNSSSTPYQSSGVSRSYLEALSSKDSSFSDDRPLSPPKRSIPVICSRTVTYK